MTYDEFREDLRKWFSKDDPQGGWKRIGTDGSVLGPCARDDKDGDGDGDGGSLNVNVGISPEKGQPAN